MKKIILSLIVPMTLLSPVAKASGCEPSDVYLVKEEVVYSLGLRELNYFGCRSPYTNCELGLSRGACDVDEVFRAQNTDDVVPAPKEKLIEFFTYRQQWESSCRSMTREVNGVNINGVRFRTEDDLTSLN